MAGKNRISRISNLDNLKKLDVLDLHSNDIHRVCIVVWSDAVSVWCFISVYGRGMLVRWRTWTAWWSCGC